MTPKVIITGGAGFIGSHLAESLIKAGQRVHIVDNLSTGSADNLSHLPRDAYTFTEGSAAEVLQQQPDIWEGVGTLYHLAASVGVQMILEDPTAMIRNNVEQTDAVVDAAARHRATLLIASSSEVYGRSTDLPLREQGDLVYGPTTSARWAYGMAKALDEQLVLDAIRQQRLSGVIVRLFNTIGPRQVGQYGMVVPRFVEQAVAGKPLQVYGDGSQTRAFCDVRDVAAAMQTLIDTPSAHGRVYNLGSDRQLSILELAEIVIRLAGTNATITRVPYDRAYPQGFEETPDRVPSLERIREAIGFRPITSLEQTLTELIDKARSQTSQSPPTRTAEQAT
ncbi:NAD-dependent epimerase/dehydratase family protein [Mucisphaera sp.]|uniref:NAD-dependent epimerase/dehydratase family protein n=1 Tax=Mucisphaera sp. TaxID=2913024 RepID=UPI003D1089D3